jgi:rhodanese-related sulfurtransferase
MKKTYLIVFLTVVIIVVVAIFIFLPKNASVNNQQAVALEAVSSVQSGDHLSPQAFLNKSKQLGVTVIDVRTKAEYDVGHIDNALNMDFYSSDFSAQLNTLDKSGTYLIYCRTGHRSGQALDIMKGLGFTNVSDLRGGYSALNH